MDKLRPSSGSKPYQPLFFHLTHSDDKIALNQLLNSDKVDEISDGLGETIEDLFKIDLPHIMPRSPEYKKTLAKYKEHYLEGKELKEKGVWVYFPWRRSLVHLPDRDDYFKLRTARNKFLITQEEQTLFAQAKIGIAGLSAGSSVLNAIVLSGGAQMMRIADPDTLAIVNLNRLMESVCNLTSKKAVNAARRIYELNPFQDLTIFSEGLNRSNMAIFFGTGNQQLDLFVEEMDDIKLKIEARFKARELKIPVIMASDNGDNIIIDVERFDLEPKRALFHGSVAESVLKNIPDQPSMIQKVRLADKIVGPNVTPRMQYSLTMVGAKLPNWPQLGNAVTLTGASLSYIARRILTGLAMPSGRYEVNLDSLIDPLYHTKGAKTKRLQMKEDFISGFQLLFGDTQP